MAVLLRFEAVLYGHAFTVPELEEIVNAVAAAVDVMDVHIYGRHKLLKKQRCSFPMLAGSCTLEPDRDRMGHFEAIPTTRHMMAAIRAADSRVRGIEIAWFPEEDARAIDIYEDAEPEETTGQ